MTQNQIRLAEHNENVRHNRVTESQGSVNLSIQRDTLGETTRHNKQSESQNQQQIGVNWFTASANDRNTREKNAIDKYRAENTAAVDLYNAITSAKRQLADEKLSNAQKAKLQAEINNMAKQYNEMVRHNKAVETETSKANRNRETQTNFQLGINLADSFFRNLSGVGALVSRGGR